MRWLAVGTLVVLAGGAVAVAPVPKESDDARMLRLYGKPEDANGDCTFKLDGPRLRLVAAKGLRGINNSRNLNTAPRALRDVSGDFTATLKIVRDVPPAGAGGASTDFIVSGGGGLLLWGGMANHLRLSRSHYPAAAANMAGGGNPTTYNFRGAAAGAQLDDQSNDLDKQETGPVTFKLVRAGQAVTASYTTNDKDWHTFEAVTLEELPATVKVGVYAAHNFDKPLEIVFEPLAVTPGAKK